MGLPELKEDARRIGANAHPPVILEGFSHFLL
eukprot:COSAG02_NODE_5518_length_4262_cov_5.311314_1_plen_32_part_00